MGTAPPNTTEQVAHSITRPTGNRFLNRLKATDSQQTRELLIVGAALAIIVGLLWVPFGLYSGDVQEHWHIRNYVDTGTIIFDNIGDLLVEVALTRPIARVLYWAAYYIDPDSFIGDNILAMVIMWGKGLALYLLLSRLFSTPPIFNFSVSVAFILYPVDEGVLSIRIPHTHMAMLATLVAINLLISYWRTPRTRTLIAMWLIAAVAGLSHEAIYPILLAAPLLLFALKRPVTQRHIRVAALWWIVPLITGLYSFVLIFMLDYGFQSNTVGDINSVTIFALFMFHYFRLFVLGWPGAVTTFFGQSATHQTISILVGIVTSVAAYMLFRITPDKNLFQSKWTRHFKLLIVVGLLQISLGFVVFSVTDRAYLVYRVYLMSSLGAAIVYVIIAYIFLANRFKKAGMYAFAVLTGVAAMLSASFHMAQKQGFVNNYYIAQRDFFEQVAREAPAPNRTGVNYVFFSEDEDYEVLRANRPQDVTSAFHNIYENADLIRFVFHCDHRTECLQTSTGISTLWTREAGDQPYAYDDIIIFNIDSTGHVSLVEMLPGVDAYDPQAIIDPDVPRPERLDTLFR